MEFRHFVQLIAIGLQARIPMHMTGFPGVGKTEFTKSLEAGFARVGIKCKVVVLVQAALRTPAHCAECDPSLEGWNGLA